MAKYKQSEISKKIKRVNESIRRYARSSGKKKDNSVYSYFMSEEINTLLPDNVVKEENDYLVIRNTKEAQNLEDIDKILDRILSKQKKKVDAKYKEWKKDQEDKYKETLEEFYDWDFEDESDWEQVKEQIPELSVEDYHDRDRLFIDLWEFYDYPEVKEFFRRPNQQHSYFEALMLLKKYDEIDKQRITNLREKAKKGK